MSTIKAIFPCKKLRRSQRLELKVKEEITTEDAISRGPLGYFDSLPLELKFVIFSYLNVAELSILTLSSKAVRNVVELYRVTPAAHRHILPCRITHSIPIEPEDLASCTEQFKNLGLLVKRSTCLYATRDRLKFIEQFLQKYLCFIHKACTDPIKCAALTSFGKFFHMVIAGWDDKECSKAFESTCLTTSMNRHLNTIVKHKHGIYPGLELHVRLFYRRVFLNHCVSNYDKAFWLEQILRPFPMVHQARVLFLLFGPMQEEDVQWHDMCESTPVTRDQAKLCFGDLANAFRVLHHYCGEWNEDDIISVMEELTSSPDEWLAENVANLLYLCGECITVKVLSSKAINGRLCELASLITSLSLVCIRYERNISWVINLITSICTVFDNPKERLAFLYGIVDMFKEVILDIHEFTDNDDDSSQDIQYMLDAQAEFTKELILLAFKTQGITVAAKPTLILKQDEAMEE